MKKTIKILLTEDKKINQDILLGILEGSGIVIDIANNGQEAIEKHHNCEYSLILMDIDMPIMNGYEATERIRLVDKNIPIVALTAHNSLEAILKIKDVGMNEYINKPIELKRLYETFFRYINRV
ncbi:MAG: response regulator [Epsilonproteobacteria bacterium]|nr:response regulator [Campylobacterota bacterium]